MHDPDVVEAADQAGLVGRFAALFDRERRLARAERELSGLRAEVEQLRSQNESMRTAMRRCITCDYRLAAKDGARDGADGGPRGDGSRRALSEPT